MYFYLSYEWQRGLHINLYEITTLNVVIKLLLDFISSLLPVIVLLVITLIKKSSIKDLGFTLKNPVLISILLLVYLVMFIVNNDFTVKGYYTAFTYLILVAFSEEFIFRGYLFGSLEREAGFWAAIVISGVLFGAAHSIMPAVMYEFTPLEFTISILNNLLGQGVLGGGVFALMYKKSKTLFVPILIHAILDYSNVLFSK
jgi:membrane protease YdiL (CAAX protease family)